MPSIGIDVLTARANTSMPNLRASSLRLATVAVDDREHLRPHFRHVGRHEAVDQRQTRARRPRPCMRLQAVDEAAHRLAAGRKYVDHPAVERGHAGRDLAAQRAQREVDDMLRRARGNRCGETRGSQRECRRFRQTLFVRWLCGSSSAAISTRAPTMARTREPADRLRNRRSPERPSRRAGRAPPRRPAARRELTENLVAQVFVGSPLQQSAGLRPGRAAFDHREALLGAAAAQHHHRRRTERRRLRMACQAAHRRRRRNSRGRSGPARTCWFRWRARR